MKAILRYTKPPHRPALFGVAGALFATLLLIGIVAAAGESLPRFVIAGAGGQTAAGNYRLLSAVGQPAAGTVQNGTKLCSGFVCGQGVSTTNTISGTLLAAVTINGPTGGPPGSYFFTAVISPANATPPITYLWDNGDAAVFSSRTLVSGTYRLVVTATNIAASAVVTDDLVVTVTGESGPSASCPNPLARVTVSGPLTVTTGSTAAYAATITPTGATTPITYTWSPSPASGQGTPNATYSFPVSGGQPVAVTAQNCGASRGAEVTVNVSPSGGPSTPRYFIPYAPDQETT